MTSAAVVAVSFVLPESGWLFTLWQVGIGWASAALVVAGARIYRPPARAAWYLFAAGVFLNSSGILVEALLISRGWVLDPPALPDAFYLSLYPALVAGLTVVIVHRRTQREWPSLIDASMVSTGLGLLVWVGVIRPSLGDPSYSALGQIVNIAYPIGDLVVLALVARLILTSGAREPAYRLLATSVGLFLLGDASWAVFNQFGIDPAPKIQALLSVVFLSAYATLGLAALHPSMRSLTAPAATPRPTRGMVMIATLTTIALIAPTLLMVEAARNQVDDGVAIAIGSMALFVLVILRMSLLYRQVQSQADALQLLTEVDELTGLPIRRALVRAVARAIDHACRDSSSVTLTILDLDYFKRFNDEYGHPAGDQLLKDASAAWLEQLHGADMMSRYGGEEFVLLLPDTGLDAAVEVLDRLQDAMPQGQSFSAGLAHWTGTETAGELIARADTALYEAKRAGRHRTVTSAGDGFVDCSMRRRSGRPDAA
ncbi:MAG TPA: GGDEF domain-containing protein [Jatrophihabitans sp.]|nr:GGDEF domain-containing protein [Jatrophihabitans sp.]